MRDYTREELLALTPELYLADGYIGSDGTPRPELREVFATAASIQFLAAELSPQELSFTYEAIRQLLPMREGQVAERAWNALGDALALVARIMQQPNNGGLVNWLYPCAEAVKTEADLDAFLDHLQAASTQYALAVSSLPEDSASSSQQ
jgi:hypothetical protein